MTSSRRISEKESTKTSKQSTNNYNSNSNCASCQQWKEIKTKEMKKFSFKCFGLMEMKVIKKNYG